uniref:Uncharacterized protein n=1 Tax=Panagrolaimus sp. PS1159 TaxID=55785 RepID=A0AC35G710_9BILA
MSKNIEENVSEVSAASETGFSATKMAGIVKTLMFVQNWLTGKADIDNNRERLENDFLMLGFFNSMHTANDTLLEGFKLRNERNRESLSKKFK